MEQTITLGMIFAKICLNALNLLQEIQCQLAGLEWMRYVKEVLETQSWASSLLQLVLVSLWFSCTSQLKQYFKEKLLSTIRSNSKILWSVSVSTVASLMSRFKSTETDKKKLFPKSKILMAL